MKKTLKSIQEQFGITPKDKLQEQGSKEVIEQFKQMSHYMEVLKKKQRSLYQAYGRGQATGINVPSNLDNVIRHLKRAADYINK